MLATKGKRSRKKLLLLRKIRRGRRERSRKRLLLGRSGRGRRKRRMRKMGSLAQSRHKSVQNLFVFVTF